MARLFARLKLRLIVNGLRRGRWYVGAVVLGALFVLPYMAAAAVGVALLGRLADLATVAAPALVVAVSLLWLGWVVGPVLVFGADETLDPARLRLLPLRRSQLAVGLLAASAVGVGPLATVVVLAGVVVGFARPGVGAVVVVAAAVVEFLLCLTAARAVTTALSRRLASRRGRDVVVVAGSAVVLVLVVLGQAPQLLLSDASAAETSRRLLDALARTATAATVLPGAWPARAVASAAGGDLLAAVGWLGAAAAAAAGFAVVDDRVEGHPGGAGTAPARRAVDLFPAAVRFLPATVSARALRRICATCGEFRSCARS